jgi:hypothetical protein
MNTKEGKKMNHLNQESNGAVAATEPLFASVWLALFNEIRKNYADRRRVKSENSADSQEQQEN